MHQADERYASHMYTRTEYDDLHVGEFREVLSYCARRHCYVIDYAAPIVAARADHNVDPDAAMCREHLPGPQHPMAGIWEERRNVRTEALRAAIESAGRPISNEEAIRVTGVHEHTMQGFIAGGDDFVVLFSHRSKFIGLPHHTEADLPLSLVEQRALDVLLRTGPITVIQLAAEMGVKSVAARDYKRVFSVEYRREKRGAQYYKVGYCHLHAHLWGQD
ncbi:MAG: hypothetical protein ACSLEZ_14450 [Thiobacillus sp.]